MDKLKDTIFYSFDRKNIQDGTIRHRWPKRKYSPEMKGNNNDNNIRDSISSYDYDASTDSDALSDIDKKKKLNNQINKKPPLSFRQKFCKRFISTWSMIGIFAFIIYLGHTFLVILICLIQALSFNEIFNLGVKPRIERQIPGYSRLYWLFFFVSIFYLYGEILSEHFLIGIKSDISGEFMFPEMHEITVFIIKHHSFLSFSLVVISLITFVSTLKKGYYKYQFKQLGWCLAIIIVVVCESTFAMKNIMDGLIWFLVPAFCIITNDVMAYMCGVKLYYYY